MESEDRRTGSRKHRNNELSAVGGIWPLLKQTFSDWSEDKAPQLGASLAFYSALSIAPLLVIALAIAAAVVGDEAAHGGVVGQLESLVGKQGGEAIESMLESANKRPPRPCFRQWLASSVRMLANMRSVFRLPLLHSLAAYSQSYSSSFSPTLKSLSSTVRRTNTASMYVAGTYSSCR